MTIRELAKLLEVSPATVSLVLNGREGVKAETRKRVMDAAREHGYHHAPKKAKKTEKILLLKYHDSGMLVEENQGFVSMIIDAVENKLNLEGYRMHMITLKSDFADGIGAIDYEQYIGVIVIGSELRQKMYPLLERIPLPFVVVDNTIPNFPYSSVCMNNHENVCLALEHCRECGHRKIGYFRSRRDFENFRARNRAFKSCVTELGMEFAPEDEFRLSPNLIGAYQDLKEILKGDPRLPSCFFADNDTIALGAIKALKEKGYKIPQDISVIGFDDIAYASISSPALTTIRVQRDIIGRQAVSQLLGLIDDPRLMPVKAHVTGSVVKRKSIRTI